MKAAGNWLFLDDGASLNMSKCITVEATDNDDVKFYFTDSNHYIIECKNKREVEYVLKDIQQTLMKKEGVPVPDQDTDGFWSPLRDGRPV